MSRTPESLYLQLGQLVADIPDLETPGPVSKETYEWLGRAVILVDAVGLNVDALTLKIAAQRLNSTLRRMNAQKIRAIVHMALAKAELAAPAGVRGAFIDAGNSLDAFATVGKVLELAATDLLFVDPYADAKLLTHYAVQGPDNGLTIRVLADQSGYKPTLKPARDVWVKQFGAKRPLEIRISAAGSLHDRLIAVDGKTAYSVGQSFNKLAERAPTSIARVDPEIGGEKIAAYEKLWQAATTL